MANPEHLAKLKEGVEAWNAWREEYSDIRPDLSGREFYDKHLRRFDLFGEDTSKADFSGIYLTEANLSWVDFSGTNLANVHLSYADLTFADLTFTNLVGGDLTSANLT